MNKKTKKSSRERMQSRKRIKGVEKAFQQSQHLAWLRQLAYEKAMGK